MLSSYELCHEQCKRERGFQFIRKVSIMVRAEEVLETAMHLNCVDVELSEFPENTGKKRTICTKR